MKTLILCLMLVTSLYARGVGGHSGHVRCSSCARDTRGHIARSPKAVRTFKKNHPCPATGSTKGACHGYVVDHVIPLKRGGADDSSNMQWQTDAAAKAKDKVE